MISRSLQIRRKLLAGMDECHRWWDLVLIALVRSVYAMNAAANPSQGDPADRMWLLQDGAQVSTRSNEICSPHGNRCEPAPDFVARFTGEIVVLRQLREVEILKSPAVKPLTR